MSSANLLNLTPISTLAELPSIVNSVDVSVPGRSVVAEFERRPETPGVTILSGGRFVGMVAREGFFQHMSRQYSREIYLCRPIGVILARHWPKALRLTSDRLISAAAQLALERPQTNAYDPIVVDHGEDDLRLLDMHLVLLAQARLLALTKVAMIENERLASIGQLAAGVAHEINNPLAFVMNNLAVLQRDLRGAQKLLDLYARIDPSPEPQNDELAREIADLSERLDLAYMLPNLQGLITRSSDGLKRIQDIVRGLRDFAKLDESDLNEVDLNQGIQSTIHVIESRAKDKGVRLELDLEPLPRVACYAAKINQVVFNLVANAIDACSENSDASVTVRSHVQRGNGGAVSGVCLEVADTGRGIDPNIRHRIFEPFYTTKAPGEGMGLGLSTSYGTIRDHGGTTEVESEIGRGSTFRVRLPLAPPGRNSPSTQRNEAATLMA